MAMISGSLQQSTFRARVDVVTVSVSVKTNGNPVTGLTTDDFVLFDNGVRQRVQATSVEDVPIDLTLFMDTSASTRGALDDMKAAVAKIAAKLRPGDRFRILTIGISVYLALPWTEATRPFRLDMMPVGGISLIYDAVAVAVREPVGAGRRHLVIALTDGRDCGSIVPPPVLLEVTRRSEAVIHWVEMSGATGPHLGTVATCLTDGAPPGTSYLTQMAESTGGARHSGLFGVDPVKEFDKILREFHASYVLTFAPTGVAATGWHALRIEVPTANYSIAARAGYVGG